MAKTANALPVRFDTSDYRLSHGKEPRGRGRWAFSPVKPGTDGYLDQVLWKDGLYSEAKAFAAAHFHGRVVVYVCS